MMEQHRALNDRAGRAASEDRADARGAAAAQGDKGHRRCGMGRRTA
eukprot:CAMPEP_0184723206 /NCGR_PEP_ID=MMETSP0314-20130426/24484_1 /TAXON_ID=38298 /ORGANISM="Rhodella maculata, Strain CCMP 736" /LENGTH=45 /DNA_ID= /DNA_START= /DNA_END= /DNA_ORIENTATION=